jgi:threonine dehydrogenase-like Zn-dependent dehydrogenase
MKGLVLFSDGSYALRDVPEPEVGRNAFAPDDVRIEVSDCGICGSDVHKWKNSDKQGVGSPTSAVVTGHEIAGTAKAVGPQAAGVKVGERVVGEPVTFYCGRCINWQTGGKYSPKHFLKKMRD